MSQILAAGGGGGGGSNVLTLTGNSGGAVGPTAGNINVLGSGAITVTGNPGTSTLTIADAGTLTPYTAVNTTPYVALSTDVYLGVDCSGGAIQINLPNAPTTGRVFTIKDKTGSADTFNITVTTVGGVVNIDGATTFVMNTEYEAVSVIFNSVSYEIF